MVAVTLLTPSTCTTCGGDSVKPHGDGGQGSALAMPPAAPVSARITLAQRAITTRSIPPMVDQDGLPGQRVLRQGRNCGRDRNTHAELANTSGAAQSLSANRVV